MPSVPKNAGQHTPAKAGSLAFEEALKKLEAIVTKMETEDLPLETLLAKYEEGTRLARTCQRLTHFPDTPICRPVPVGLIETYSDE